MEQRSDHFHVQSVRFRLLNGTTHLAAGICFKSNTQFLPCTISFSVEACGPTSETCQGKHSISLPLAANCWSCLAAPKVSLRGKGGEQHIATPNWENPCAVQHAALADLHSLARPSSGQVFSLPGVRQGQASGTWATKPCQALRLNLQERTCAVPFMRWYKLTAKKCLDCVRRCSGHFKA